MRGVELCLSTSAPRCQSAVRSQRNILITGVFNGDVPVTTDNILGAASLIIWTITAIPVIKYIYPLPALPPSTLRDADRRSILSSMHRRYALIVLRADDNGQGMLGSRLLQYRWNVANPCFGSALRCDGLRRCMAGGSFALYAQLRRQGLPDPEQKTAAAGDPNASGRSSHLTGTTPPRVMVGSDPLSTDAGIHHACNLANQWFYSRPAVPTLFHKMFLTWQDWRQRFIQARSTQLILMLAVVFGVGLSTHRQPSYDRCYLDTN